MPAPIELRAASAFTAERLAAVFTDGYAGYALPIRLDADAFTAMATVSDFDLDRSRVALREDDPVGIVALGVRGRRGWIGGMGVAEEARRTGVGLALIEAALVEARAAGLESVSLEVLEANEAATRLYERVGFERTRVLEVWAVAAAADDSRAREVDFEKAQELIRALRAEPEPWQRADETVEHLRARGAELTGLVVGEAGGAVVRVGENVSVLQLAAVDDETAGELIAAGRSRGRSLSFVNVPAGSTASTALAKLGARLDARQHEMRVALD